MPKALLNKKPRSIVILRRGYRQESPNNTMEKIGRRGLWISVWKRRCRPPRIISQKASDGIKNTVIMLWY